MLRDRALQIKLTKPSPTPQEATDEALITNERLVTAGFIIADITKKITIGVAAYVLLDTFRQTQIARIMKETS